MNEMVDRVTLEMVKVIRGLGGKLTVEAYAEQGARAVIAAMREPTLAMCVRIDPDGNSHPIGDSGIWRAMIDAAIGEAVR